MGPTIQTVLLAETRDCNSRSKPRMKIALLPFNELATPVSSRNRISTSPSDGDPNSPTLHFVHRDESTTDCMAGLSVATLSISRLYSSQNWYPGAVTNEGPILGSIEKPMPIGQSASAANRNAALFFRA